MVETCRINVETKGNCHVVDITADVSSAVADSGVVDGAAGGDLVDEGIITKQAGASVLVNYSH